MHWLARLFHRTPTLDPALWRDAASAVPWVARLDDARRARLADLVGRFLAQKAITPVGGLMLQERERVMLAALCCLPVLEFGPHGLDGWSEVIVYPDAFRAQRSHMDAAGVLHEGEQDLEGESWEFGPLIVSWADVQAEIEVPDDGLCVVVHEMAHKLDGLDGAFDGTPLLPRAWQVAWARDFQQAYDALVARVDAGHEVPIDDYAAESPEEFFAVCSEYHFTLPSVLEDAMPAVAGHLRRFYGPSPFA